jgi:putative Mn2+ efflux pump MntP
MAILDRVFELIFARFRRNLGDNQLEFAWRRAANAVSGFLVLPIAAAMLVLVTAVYALTGYGTPVDHRRYGQIAGVVVILLTFMMLHRRFKKYLFSPPVLTRAESREERLYVFWFRAVAIAIFILVCVIGFSLRKAGVHFIQGI